MLTLERVPPHLRQYVAVQDDAAYSAIDHAVWRFILLQLGATLRRTAHPAYLRGFEAAGMSTERIPRIPEMDRHLASFGWGAVCVDGFIPPRAFVDFQALGILPIAGAIRTRQHLAYTPAPDIVHEAAGHAPILPDPDYARFLQAIGRVGQSAFSVPEDHAVYRAVYLLSELKEDSGATPEQLRAAEDNLERALANVTVVSEAAQLARLYWWTAEYGLIGTPQHYQLYGAGLLSSLGESHSCHDPSVRKLPLTEACVEVGYDITRPQPQLFLVPEFTELSAVLARVQASFASHVGGATALERAHRSRELATVEFASGVRLRGVVDRLEWSPEGEPLLVGCTGRGSVSVEDASFEARSIALPLGRLVRDIAPVSGSRQRWELDSGVIIVGTVLKPLLGASGRLLGAWLADAELRVPGLAAERFAEYPLLFPSAVVSARAGAEGFHAPSDFTGTRVPRAPTLSASEQALDQLYRRAAASGGSPATCAELEAVYHELSARHPDEWLLRWMLLERLRRGGESSAVARALHRDLLALEVQYARQQPIASGLRYLGLPAAA